MNQKPWKIGEGILKLHLLLTTKARRTKPQKLAQSDHLKVETNTQPIPVSSLPLATTHYFFHTHTHTYTRGKIQNAKSVLEVPNSWYEVLGRGLVGPGW